MIGASSAPNANGRMSYAYARLRAEDEARSEQLARDPRVYRPDPDEAGAVACVICEGETGSSRALVCPECRAAGWVAGSCRSCGGHITRQDQQADPPMQGRCRACRDAMRTDHDTRRTP